MTTELKDLLERAAEHVSGPDLTVAAWGAAEATRRRRRLQVTAATAALAAGAAVVFAVTVLPRGSDARGTRPASSASSSPEPSTPLATGAQPWRAAPVDLMGVAAIFGPSAAQAASLPRVDARTAKTLGLPESLNASPAELRPWSRDQAGLVARGENAAPVTAVLLRRGASGSVFPVLYRPSLSRPWLVVDTVPLGQVTDIEGNESAPLGDRAISPDGRRVAFAQADKVVVLDVVTAQVRTIDVADPYLEDVGWMDDGSALVARSAGRQWRVDPATGAVTSYGDPAYAGRHEVVVSGGEVLLRSQQSLGLLDAGKKLPGIFAATWGETVSGPSGRVAVAGNLSVATEATAPTRGGTVPYQGVLTVTADTLEDPAILLAPPNEEDGLGKGCCRALRWLDDGKLLLVWEADLLVWDAQARTFARASVRPAASDSQAAGTLTGSFAVAP